MTVALPPLLALIPFAIVLAVVVFFSLVNITHLLRYGASGFAAFFVTFLYVCGAATLVFVTLQHLPDVAWTVPVSVGGSLPANLF